MTPKLTKKRLQTEEADKAKVAQHLVQQTRAKGPSRVAGVAALFEHLQLVVDVGLADERVEHVEDNVHVPDLGVIRQLRLVLRNILLLVALGLNFRPKDGKIVELREEREGGISDRGRSETLTIKSQGRNGHLWPQLVRGQ